MGTGALSARAKLQGREADHSPPVNAEVKKIWIYTSTLHTPSWCSAKLVTHKDNFTFFYFTSLNCEQYFDMDYLISGLARIYSIYN
jgi:hypothetical protein